MLKIKELKEKLNKYDEDTIVAFELLLGSKDYENKIRIELSAITSVDYLGEFDNEVIFELNDAGQLVEKVKE